MFFPRELSNLMPESINIKRNLAILLVVSAAIRAILAASFALGNDEVYYWTYALYPSLSYFDHPPMVAWLIRLFTFNLNLNHEFFVRLASIIAGTINTWLIFRIGKKLRDELTGWYAALLYTASVYSYIITGIFILPDTPQTFFWLVALGLMINVLPDQALTVGNRKTMLLIGVMIGLGMLSKYTTAFLWVGMMIYIVSRNRKWFTTWQFYAANLLIVLIFSPVIAWNFSNSFVSFMFHSQRLEVSGYLVNVNSLLTELGGELLYTNPVNVVLLILAIIAVSRKSTFRQNESIRLLLWTGLPLILIFWVVSLFRNTLPHWSGPGYMSLIPVTALWLRSLSDKPFPKVIRASLSFLCILLVLCVVQIKTGIIPWPGVSNSITIKGEKDISLELVGWRQLGKEFEEISNKYESSGEMPAGAPIISYRWFPAANLEYYAAKPANLYVLAAGPLNTIHQYAFVNEFHGGFRLNTDAWFITSSRDFRSPETLKHLYFKELHTPDTITISRGGKPAYYFFVYRMKNMQAKPEDPFRTEKNN